MIPYCSYIISVLFNDYMNIYFSTIIYFFKSMLQIYKCTLLIIKVKTHGVCLNGWRNVAGFSPGHEGLCDLGL